MTTVPAERTPITCREQLASFRYPQHTQMLPEWQFYPQEIDLLPIDTFLIDAVIGTGGAPGTACRVVKPNDPSRYLLGELTPGLRVLYHFWNRAVGARRSLRRMRTSANRNRRLTFRYVVLPGDPGFDLLEAFKVACDTKRSGASVWVGDSERWPMRSTLIDRALGWPPA